MRARVKQTAGSALLALTVLVAATLAAPAAFAADQNAVARSAINAADKGRWGEAYDTAAREPLIRKMITWMDITRPSSTVGFDQIVAFIAENPDWPLPKTLRQRAEEAILPGADPTKVLAFFTRNPPLSPAGATANAEALNARGDQAGAAATVRKFYADGKMSAAQARDFATRWSTVLRPEDAYLRADRLVWDGELDDAAVLTPSLTGQSQAIIQARLALARNSADVATTVSRLDENSLHELGVMFERARWLRRGERDTEAVAMLDATPPTVPRPEKWWAERNTLARRALDRGNAAEAYRIAAEHRQTEGQQLNEAEWLAGYIALRSLDQPERAVRHFETMRKTVTTPISVARAQYWLGRAKEKLGDQAGAEAAYRGAMNHVGTFYGQLALAKVSPRTPLSLPSQPVPSKSESDLFSRRELVEMVRILDKIDEDRRSEIFLRRVVELADKPVDALLTVRLAKEVRVTSVVVQVAKKLAQNGVALLADGYPTMHVGPGAPEPALVHAIIRQESLFDPGATSPVGAQGLMQLMPATAKLVAGQLKVKHQPAMLTKNPGYNVQLGSAYLDQLVGRFSGSYVMAAAGYNAGPGRPVAWRRDGLDPKADLERSIDFIERIPFQETRNYVQRVMENLAVYRARLSGGSAPLRIEEDLVR